jgi:hypothetical protein
MSPDSFVVAAVIIAALRRGVCQGTLESLLKMAFGEL